MAREKTLVYTFKRGDDFKLDFTLSDTNHTTAIDLKADLDTQNEILQQLKAADPVDSAAVAAQDAIVIAADAAYEAAIVMDLTGWVITSQIRLHNELVNDFVIDESNLDIGKFAVTLPAAQTALWKPGKHEVDIQFSRVAGIISSKTFIVDVEKDITHG